MVDRVQKKIIWCLFNPSFLPLQLLNFREIKTKIQIKTLQNQHSPKRKTVPRIYLYLSTPLTVFWVAQTECIESAKVWTLSMSFFKYCTSKESSSTDIGSNLFGFLDSQHSNTHLFAVTLKYFLDCR